MRNFAYHIIIVVGVASLLSSSCKKEERPSTVSGQVLGQMTITDEFVGDETKTETFKHLDHQSTYFNAGDSIQVCIDYSFQPNIYVSSSPIIGEKYQYVHGIPFVKQGSGVFTSEYNVLWLSDYAFDVYAVYPFDVTTIDIEGYTSLDLEDNLTYHRIPVTYKSLVKVPNSDPEEYARACVVPQYYSDALDGKNYVCTGASIYRRDTKIIDGQPCRLLAADPHDLITSVNKAKVTIGTKYPDHKGDDIKMQFKHMLSRLQLKFVNGLGAGSEVYLKGIAIYPDVTEAKYALKRDLWVDVIEETLFEYRDGDGWYYRETVSSPWSADPIVDFSKGNPQWVDFYNNAPVVYTLNTAFRLNSIDAVTAVDKIGTEDYIIEFRMIPNSSIDFMILHFEVEGAEAYLPVRLRSDYSDGNALTFREGHLTQLILSYKATMITLLYVNVLKDWTELENRYVTGDLNIT